MLQGCMAGGRGHPLADPGTYATEQAKVVWQLPFDTMLSRLRLTHHVCFMSTIASKLRGTLPAHAPCPISTR